MRIARPQRKDPGVARKLTAFEVGREHGICVGCGNPRIIDDDTWLCERCTETHATFYAKHPKKA